MSPLPRPKPSPGVLVRALVSLGAVWAVAAALAAYVAGRAVPGPGFGAEFATLVVIGALARRYGVALPGNGFSSYILGVTAFAVLDRGWACAVLVGPTAMVAGDLMLRRLPPRAALVNAAHLTAGTAVVGLMYDRLGGVAGPDTFDPANLGPLVALLTLLPVVVNATFYLELALGRSLAWVDAWLTARWETIVYACSAGLALAWLRLAHAGLGPVETFVAGEVLATATATSVYVVRLGVRADELALIQGLSQVLALLAPQLVLMLAIETSVQPVVGASERTTTYIGTLTATTQEIHVSSQEVAASAQRASHGAKQAASLVSAVARESDQLKQHASEVAAAGDQTREAGAQMEQTTDKVRVATETAVRRLKDLGVTTEESASEVRRLRDVAEQVEKFSETIGFIANQTNLLALNATIEAARAGVHGRGFAVVADEVHKLAEASGREARAVGKSAQDTRGALDQAAQLLERVREDLTEVVQGSSAWVADLSQIAAAATGTARAGKRVAELARGIADLSGRIGTSLGQARVGAQASAADAEAVAAAATEQLKAIAELTHGATELTQLADNLAKAVRFVRGENGHP